MVSFCHNRVTTPACALRIQHALSLGKDQYVDKENDNSLSGKSNRKLMDGLIWTCFREVRAAYQCTQTAPCKRRYHPFRA